MAYVPSAEASVTLQAGKSYYIEVYHINLGGPGYLKVSTQVPNQDTSLNWQTHTVQRLDLSYTNDPEIVRFTQTGASSGQINLTVVTRTLGRPPTVEFAVIDFDATLSSFLAAIRSLSLFSAYTISGVRDMYDSNGTATSDPLLAFTYTWTVTVVEMRTTAHLNAVITPVYVNYSGSRNFTQTVVRPHGPLISGTF